MVKQILFFFLLCTLLSCKEEEKYLVDASGSDGDIVVVADTNLFNTIAYKEFSSFLERDIEGLNQQEPYFKLIPIEYSKFKNILKKHLNVVFFEKTSSADSTGALFFNNVYAKNQSFCVVKFESYSDLDSILSKNRAAIEYFFQKEELNKRYLKILQISQKEPNANLLKSNIKVIIPKEYNLVKSSENFYWFKSEILKQEGNLTHEIVKNLVISFEPYFNEKQLNVTYLSNYRDSIGLNITGSKPDRTYTIQPEIPVWRNVINLKSKFVVIERGMWQIKNDFIGGSFVDYHILNKQKNIIIHCTGFVFAPNFNKRSYIKDFEAIFTQID